jgi:molybdopterin molybdotransferase
LKDGYALVSDATSAAAREKPVTLRKTGVLYAGMYSSRRLSPGEAIRIMTGALLPPGADAVVPWEEVQEESHSVRITGFVVRGSGVEAQGQQLTRGEVIVGTNQILGPQEISILASAGKTRVQVYKQPRVAIIVIGDELVELGEKVVKGKEVASNCYLLSALLTEAGAQPIICRVVPDNKGIIMRMFRQIKGADMLLSSGGASLGDRDFTEQALKDVGAQIKYREVAINPGRRHIFALYRGRPVFGLPGSPLALTVVFEQLVRPGLLKMGGRGGLFRPRISAALTHSVKGRLGEATFREAVLFRKGSRLFAEPVRSWRYGRARDLAGVRGFIRLKEDQGEVESGGRVTVQLMQSADPLFGETI